jgi:hypothetical protein
MIGYTLTPKQYDQIQGQYYSKFNFFNCLYDINGFCFLFLLDKDKHQVKKSKYNWVLDLPNFQ